MLFVTTCCIFKSTFYMYLFNNCKEKYTFSTRPRVLKHQISQEILVGIVIFLCLYKNLPLSSSTWSKLHFNNQDETVSIRSWIFHILAILLRTSQVDNVWALTLLWPGKPALWVLQRELSCRQFHFKKLLNYTAILGSFFYSQPTEIIVEIQLIVCYQITIKKK